MGATSICGIFFVLLSGAALVMAFFFYILVAVLAAAGVLALLAGTAAAVLGRFGLEKSAVYFREQEEIQRRRMNRIKRFCSSCGRRARLDKELQGFYCKRCGRYVEECGELGFVSLGPAQT